jgi:hypothetical protein
VGLVARFLEENGIATLALTTTPEFNREIGFPRVAAIEYPYGRVVGAVNDVEGQRQVLMAALAVFETAEKPGQVVHLPFTWPEEGKQTKWHPPEISPIIKLYLDEIKKTAAEKRT